MTKIHRTVGEKTTVKKTASIKRGFVHKKTNETFWNVLRAKNGLTLGDVAELTGINRTTVSAHFLGRWCPNEYQINRYCDVFDIDPKTARLEFDKTRTMFMGSQRIDNHGQKREMTSATAEKIEKEIKKETFKVEVDRSKEINTASIINKMYGHLSRGDWDKLRFVLGNSESIDRDTILDLIYNQVPIDVYLSIESEL